MFRVNSSRRPWVIALVSLAALALALPAAAQSGLLRGVVKDAQGKLVEGASIVIELNESGRKFQARTGKNGEYQQIGLVGGVYNVTVTKDGLGTVSRQINLRGSQANTADFVIAPGATPEGTIDPRVAQITKVFDEGLTSSRAGNHDEAIAKFQEILLLNPKCADCYINIGYSNTQKKDYDKAVDAYRLAIELKPDSAEAYGGLANVYNAQRKFDDAAAASKKATELSAGATTGAGGGSPDALYNQGVILFNQGKIPEAKPLFESALQADPNHAEAHYMLGMSLAGTDPSKAVAEFETYLKLAPQGRNAALAKQFVDALKK